MSRFVWGSPERLSVGGGQLPPRTAKDLLDDLGVSQADAQSQRQAVNWWLTGHSEDVDELMRLSLERNGFRGRPVQLDAWSGARRSTAAGFGTFVIGDDFPHEMRISELPDALVTIAIARSEPNTCVFALRRPGATIFVMDESPDQARVG